MKQLTALIFSAAFLGGTALANQDFDFETADADGDGKLSQAEVSSNTKVAANFEAWDANGDGFLDQAEVSDNLGIESISDEGTSDEALQDDRTDVEYDPMWEDNQAEGETTDSQEIGTDDSNIVDDRTDNNSGIDE